LNNSIYENVTRHAKELGMFYFDTLGIGVSGGADSMTLCNILKEHFKLIIIHINHNLRDKARTDEKFVSDYAKSIGAKFYSKKVDLSGNKDGIENEGRKERYAFFGEVAKLEDCPIVTAHNLTDSAESIIMHFLRGTSPSSVHPIESSLLIDGVRYFRPLSQTSKSEVLDYCRKNKIKYREDETNADIKYFRNFIRNEILPRFGEKPVINYAEILATENDYLDKLARENLDKIDNTKEFNKMDVAVKRRVLNMILQNKTDKTIGKIHIDAILSMLDKNVGSKKIELPDGIIAELKNKQLTIY